MTSKRELKAQLDAANSMIEYLRAKLCEDDHEYVRVGEKVTGGAVIDIEPVYVCTRCLKKKVGFYGN